MRPYEKMTKDNTALVVIDIVNSCCHEQCENPEWGITYSKIREMIPRLDNFIEEFRSKIGGKIIFTISEGGIVKYLEPALSLAEKYDLSPYIKQSLELTKRYIESVFDSSEDENFA